VLKYSVDGTNFYCIDRCRVFKAPAQNLRIAEIEIANPVFAQIIILVPKKWNSWPSIRTDFYYDQITTQSNCLIYNTTGKCSRCENNYTNVNGICRLLVLGCQTVDEQSGQCQQCFD
jgi:hypothetical protein